MPKTEDFKKNMLM